MKISWKQKLSSRRFWAAVAGFFTALGAAFGIDSMTSNQIVAVISALGILAAYIIGESCVDVSRARDTKGESNSDS
ncbi:MAG TPA: hypothetical protein GX011_00320 [Clostridiales bacterium]|jgi:phage shock protein PspC (stress-responsive transcriptional regulator)|nr:hypothetical protein [Clostridiales bacterium]